MFTGSIPRLFTKKIQSSSRETNRSIVNTCIKRLYRKNEDFHDEAVRKGLDTYFDPQSQCLVSTEIKHLKRGRCCGSGCIHCPYGWEHVDRTIMGNEGMIREAKVMSYDEEGIQLMLKSLVKNDNMVDISSNIDGSNEIIEHNVD